MKWDYKRRGNRELTEASGSTGRRMSRRMQSIIDCCIYSLLTEITLAVV